jgi:hypothetical protein
MTPTKFTPDGRPVYYFSASTDHSNHQTNKGLTMSNSIDSIVASLSSLSPELKRELIQRLSADTMSQLAAAAADGEKKLRLTRISACRDSRDREFMAAQGILNRAAINVEDCVDARAFDRLCAASDRPPSSDARMVAKAALFNLGIMKD